MAKQKKSKPRDWTPREQRLVSEFVNRFYRGHEVKLHARLGTVQPRLAGRYATDADLRLVGLFRRWADAVVFQPDRVVLIEGKILPQPGVLSQLNLYERVFAKTPEFSEHAHKPIEKVLLCAIEDPVVTQLAREQNVRVVVFRPKWIDSYLKILYPRERTPTPSDLD